MSVVVVVTAFPVQHQEQKRRGKTAYVVNLDGTVSPIQTATNTVGPAITVGSSPEAIAITRDGKTCLRRQLRLRFGEPDQHRHQHGRRGHQGRPRASSNRHHAVTMLAFQWACCCSSVR